MRDSNRPQGNATDSANAAFQQRAFHALLSISEAIDEEPTISQLFERALHAVREATDFDSVAMRIYEPGSDCFRLLVQRGMSEAMVQELACISAHKGFLAEITQTKQPAVTSDLVADPRLGGTTPLEMGYRSLACVPLLANGEVVGSMELASPTVYKWTPEHISWLSLVGRTVGVFVHHVQLTSQLRDAAVLRERSLIAQEIHDGLAQQIGSIFVWAEDAQFSLQEQNTDAAQSALQHIEETARDAYGRLREEMLGLRETPASEERFIPQLQQYLERFQRQWSIEIQLVVANGDGKQAMPVTITPGAEIQLLRILQEILTNVRRHACASKVQLKLAEEDRWLIVDVKDDGSGFNPQQVSDEHLGLCIIRERAKSVGGRIKLQTSSGQGTHVRVELPPRSER
ncbi:MAG: ATP-binding protein [Chloroflexota bacterium]